MWKAWQFLQRGMSYADERNASLISAGVAFYGVFAIFPGIAATIALFGLLADPAVVTVQLELLRDFIPPGPYDLFRSQIEALLGAGGLTLGWATLFSIGLALWSARAGVAALMRGLNAMFDRPNRGGVRHMAVAMLLTLSLIGMVIVALLMVVVLPVLEQIFPALERWTWSSELLRWSIALGVLILGLGMLYRFGPNKRGERLPWITPGALLVVVLWFAVSAGFSLYVANFASYNEVYGSIGAVIALLMWFYLSAYLILLGAAFNRALELRRRRNSSGKG